MVNPFDLIIEKLNCLETQLSTLSPALPFPKSEIINRDELCKILNITEPTAIRWEKKGKIPSFRIGSNIRYNWPKVIDSLESQRK